MSILISGPLNFSADVMKWVSTDVSWKWQHVSLLPGWCSLLVYRCVAWCTHRMAHCHLIKYHSCFDREALIESLVSFIKLCVIVVWNFFPLFTPQPISLALMEYVSSWILCNQEKRRGGEGREGVEEKVKSEREQHWVWKRNKSKRTPEKEREEEKRPRETVLRKSLQRLSCHWIHNSGSWF